MITVKIAAGFGSTMLTEDPEWTELGGLRYGSTTRGRSSVDQRFETGTASLILNLRDGDLDPLNTSSPYYPNVQIGVPIRVYSLLDDSTEHDMFYGSVRGWVPSYPTGNQDATVQISLADGFYTLNNEDLAGKTYPLQRTDERIDAVLDDIGWSASKRDLDVGVGMVQAKKFASPGDGGEHSALAHLLDVAESEAGVLFMGPDGSVVFRNRIANSGATAAAVYTGEDDYSEIDPKPDDAVLYNVIRIARENGAQIEYIDTTSVGKHGRRVLTRDVMPMATDAEAVNVAEWIAALFGEQRRRIDGLKFKALKDPDLLEEMVTLDLREAITIQHQPPNADAFSALCVIEQITHEFPPGDFTTTWSAVPLATSEQGPFFQLDVSQLDGTDYLA